MRNGIENLMYITCFHEVLRFLKTVFVDLRFVHDVKKTPNLKAWPRFVPPRPQPKARLVFSSSRGRTSPFIAHQMLHSIEHQLPDPDNPSLFKPLQHRQPIIPPTNLQTSFIPEHS